MKKEVIVRLYGAFEEIARTEEESGVEFWFARDLQKALGYTQWRNFESVIRKAVSSCVTSGYNSRDHFAKVSKMVDIGSDTKREIDDIALTRYACYLIAQNGDPTKEQIAFAQTYFAVQTRKQEIIEKRLALWATACWRFRGGRNPFKQNAYFRDPFPDEIKTRCAAFQNVLS